MTDAESEWGRDAVEDRPVHEAGFTVVYDGPALADHSIDVRDLAPALFALGELFEEANRTCNDDRAKVNLVVRATPAGSFEVELRLIQTLAQQLTGILSGSEVTAALNLKEIVFGVGSTAVGLIAFFKWLRGRRPSAVEPDGDRVRVTVENATIVVNQKVLALSENIRVHRAVAALTRPLEREGVDVLRIKDGEAVIETIDCEDLASFKFAVAEDVEEEISDETYRMALTLVSVVFRDDNKWRVSDGSAEFYVSMVDDRFMELVAQGRVSFTAGDILICKLRSRQTRAGARLKTDYEVVEVFEHKRAFAARCERVVGFAAIGVGHDYGSR